MLPRPLWFPLTVVLGAIACAAPSKRLQSKPTDAITVSRSLPQTREERARALVTTTLAAYSRLGFRLNGESLKVQVKTQSEFVEGIARNARYFELPGLYDALSATARLFGANFGRSPAELRALSPLALGEVTLAYYDFDVRALVLRDDPDANAMSLDDIVAHELGHAYQDIEQGGLKRYITSHSSSPDALRAAHSVLEGQATLLNEALRLHERGLSIAVLNPNLSDPTVGRLTSGEGYSLIYEAGRRFLLMRHPQASIRAIVDAFSNPPSSTEQLLHPEKCGLDLPRQIELPTVPVPLRSSKVLFDGTLGEMLLYNRLLPFKKGLHETRLAVTGWDGDRLRVLKLPNGAYGVSWRLVWDRIRDAVQFCSFVSPLLRGETNARLSCRGNVTDLSYAETPVEAQQLAYSFTTLEQVFLTDEADARSTHAAEAQYERLESLRPTVAAGRWVWPALGLSFAVPASFFPVDLNGVDVLSAMPVDGFANNVSVTFEQDLYGGDLKAYVREQERVMHSTSQTWKGSYAVAVGGQQGMVINTLVPSNTGPASVFLLLASRDNGTLVSITVATREQEEALGRQLIDGITKSLEFRTPARP